MTVEDAPFSRFMLRNLERVPQLRELYAKNIRFLNYMMIYAVIGVLVTYVMYHVMIYNFVWEPVAFYIGVGTGFASNYTFNQGALRHIFGLVEEKKDEHLPLA